MSGRLRRLALLALLAAPAALPLWVDVSLAPPRLRLATGMLDGHDPGFDVLRTAEIHRGLVTGQFPVRWTPDMARGYGQPLFLFYAPGTYYAAEVFHLAGLRFVDAVKATYLAAFVAAAAFAFLLGRELWGPAGGWALAALYTYAPYHLADVYVRSSLGESAAFVWPPLVLWGAWRYARDGRPAGWAAGALGIAALPLTHNIAAMMLVPILALFIALAAPGPGGRGRWPGLAGMLAAGLGLSAWFWLPALTELGALPGEFTSHQFHFTEHFARPWQLLSRAWGFQLVAHPGDPGGMSLQIGAVQIAAALAAALLLLRRDEARPRGPRRRCLLLALVAAPAFAFLILQVSRPIWDAVPGLPLVQLPWRFLLPLAFCASLAGAAAPLLAPAGRPRRIAGAIVVAAAVAASLPYCRAHYREAPADAQLDRAGFLDLQHPYSTTSLQMEYLPRGVRRLPAEPARELLAPPAGCALDQVRLGSDLHFFDAVCERAGEMRIRQFYFPGWTVWVDKREVPLRIDPEEGTFAFALPAGAHRVKVAFRATPVRRFATLATLATLVAALASWLARRGGGAA